MLALTHAPDPLQNNAQSDVLHSVSARRDGLTNCIVEFALQTCSVLGI